MWTEAQDRPASVDAAGVMTDQITYRAAPAWGDRWVDLLLRARRAGALPALVIRIRAGSGGHEPLVVIRASDFQRLIEGCKRD